LLVSFDIDPAAIRKPATGKSDRMRPFAIYKCQLQIAADRCDIYRFPLHMKNNYPPRGRWSVI
jgi:hypothetical protein